MPSDANKHPNNATDKLINTITLVLNTNCVDTNIKQQIIYFSNIILNQNSYLYKEKLHMKNMNCDWCPYILSFLWNLYHIEHTNVINMLRKNLIIGYFRHVDILIISENTKPILTTHWKISIRYIHWKLKFVMGEEEDMLNFS